MPQNPAEFRGAVPERVTSNRAPSTDCAKLLPRCVAPTALRVRESQTQGFRPGLASAAPTALTRRPFHIRASNRAHLERESGALGKQTSAVGAAEASQARKRWVPDAKMKFKRRRCDTRQKCYKNPYLQPMRATPRQMN
jgi:hypothetical protein